MTRVAIVGPTGAGKTTLATALAARLGVPHVELDAIYHQAGWTPLPPGEFRARVRCEVARDGWVVDGNYEAVRELVWSRADAVVWLDLGRATVMRRIVTRTLRRIVGRQELWNGNTERWPDVLSTDPHRSVVAWAWATHAAVRRRYEAAMVDPRWSRLRFVRLHTTDGAVERVCGALGGAASAAFDGG